MRMLGRIHFYARFQVKDFSLGRFDDAEEEESRQRWKERETASTEMRGTAVGCFLSR